MASQSSRNFNILVYRRRRAKDVAAPGPVTDDGFLLEDGTSFLLKETTEFLLLE